MKFLLLSAMIISSSLFAVEIKLEPGVNYNGGDGKAGACVLKLVSIVGENIMVEAHPSMNSRKLSGAGRIFSIVRKNANTFIGKGSFQEYLNAPGTPNTIVANPNDLLRLELREDGTPSAFLISNSTFEETALCKELMDAPY